MYKYLQFSVFRIFDKVGQGFIGVDQFREILREIDDKVSDDELDGIIAYVSKSVSQRQSENMSLKRFGAF